MGNKLQNRRSARLRGNNVTDCTVRETALNKVIAPMDTNMALCFVCLQPRSYRYRPMIM